MTRLCSVEGCSKKHFANDLCAMHNYRLKKHGSPHILQRLPASGICSRDGCDQPVRNKGLCVRHYDETRAVCTVDGCDKPVHAHGVCSRHAYHVVAHGDPLSGRFGSSPGEPLQWIEDHSNYQGDDCLKWPFEVNKRTGYGNVKHNGQKRIASRVMCEAAHGEPPSPDMDAAHSCGNGHLACMNQNHLSWKTRVGNVADAIAHGTWNHGEKVPQSKLTEADVREIRALAPTTYQRVLAERFGVHQGQISRIIRRLEWAWLD